MSKMPLSHLRRRVTIFVSMFLSRVPMWLNRKCALYLYVQLKSLRLNRWIRAKCAPTGRVFRKALWISQLTSSLILAVRVMVNWEWRWKDRRNRKLTIKIIMMEAVASPIIRQVVSLFFFLSARSIYICQSIIYSRWQLQYQYPLRRPTYSGLTLSCCCTSWSWYACSSLLRTRSRSFGCVLERCNDNTYLSIHI